jgi:hypothetical protein
MRFEKSGPLLLGLVFQAFGRKLGRPATSLETGHFDDLSTISTVY